MSNEQEYRAALHAVQSGVAMKMNYDGGPATGETSPKHLRVGVNAAMIDSAAMATLLISKGLITEEEYTAALVESSKREVQMYENWLKARLGTNVTLR